MINDYVRLASRSDVILLDSIDSTNTYATRLIAAGSAPDSGSFAVVADMQTAGRGRFGRSFLSPSGSGIYLSYVFRNSLPESELPKVTPIVAVVAHEIASKYSKSPVWIKWVNDLNNDSGKFSGILTELVSGPSGTYVVIGIGLNCYEVPGSEKLPGMGYITTADDTSFSRDKMASELIEAFDRTFGQGNGTLPDCLEYYRAHCRIIGMNVTVKPVSGTPYEAYVKDVSDGYELLIVPHGSDNIVTLNSGEVSVSV